MLNPYVILTPDLLRAMLKQPMYFVRQFYSRGLGPYTGEGQTPLLFTHYLHIGEDKERAQRHMRLLWKDKYRFLYDSTNKDHLEKLFKAADQPQGFEVYINLLPAKWKPSDLMKEKIRRYMINKLPWWKFSTSDKLKVTLKDRYGELYLALLWKGQQTEVHLTEIESFSVCAMT